MTASTTQFEPGHAGRPRSRKAAIARERGALGLLGVSAAVSVLTTFAIIVVLFTEAARFFALPEVTLHEFFLTATWSPLLGAEKHFGIWPLVCGTVLVTAVSACVALPLGLIAAVYLSEYAPKWARAVLKPVLELLAGIPTVVYGFFALTVITPALIWLQRHAAGPVAEWVGALPRWVAPEWLARLIGREVDSYNALSAGLAVGIMTLPMVCSLSEDALQAVPRPLKEAAYALGGTRLEVSMGVVVPAALSGIIASFLLAIARAIGETMIVALAAGGLARLTLDPRDQVQTMTAYMVQIFLGDAGAMGVEYRSSYAVAAMLFVITLFITIVGHLVLTRYREAYH